MILEKIVRTGILVCLAAALAAASSVDITYLLHNTGAASGASGTDQNWTVGGAAAYVTDLCNGTFPAPYWLAENTDDPSAWISPSPNYIGLGSDAENTTFDFETKFDLTGYYLDGTSLLFRYAVDNHLTDVQINGHSVSFASGAGMTAWSDYSTISGTGLFINGENTIDFFVRNDGGTVGNPAGLRVEMSGTNSTPEPGSCALIGSGILLFGGLLRRKLAR